MVPSQLWSWPHPGLWHLGSSWQPATPRQKTCTLHALSGSRSCRLFWCAPRGRAAVAGFWCGPWHQRNIRGGCFPPTTARVGCIYRFGAYPTSTCRCFANVLSKRPGMSSRRRNSQAAEFEGSATLRIFFNSTYRSGYQQRTTSRQRRRPAGSTFFNQQLGTRTPPLLAVGVDDSLMLLSGFTSKAHSDPQSIVIGNESSDPDSSGSRTGSLSSAPVSPL